MRFDTALYQGYVIPPFYDSMIGKLIVYAGTREEAMRKMQAALCELVIEGVRDQQRAAAGDHRLRSFRRHLYDDSERLLKQHY